VRRRLYGPDHEAYRETVREFLTREVVPYQHDWDRQHMIDRTVFARAAKAGIYGLQIDERFGGAGEHDYRYRMVVCEELARVFAFSFADRQSAGRPGAALSARPSDETSPDDPDHYAR
jgi:alkylation response protein AidB-like acyl-CoA dehydrogenase